MEFIPVNVSNRDIEFKEINVSDFKSYTATKEIITPNNDGYISDLIKDPINIKEKNTVVINAGVGQGKTKAIINMAKDFIEQDYIVIFAVPYNSLIDQYNDELEEIKIAANDIFDFRRLKKEPLDINSPSYSDCKIHLITINGLLGNPGEDWHEQSIRKQGYFDDLITKFKREGKKVVLIFDEIHDSIHNFQARFIYNLWKWKDIMHKIFCISATFNEASKIVIKYLAELTDDKIQILESKRLKVESKRSDLYIYLYNKFRYEINDDFKQIFNSIREKTKKKINILSYSKNLAEKINTKAQELFPEFKKEINLCTGDNENKFDETKLNIGTNFSTGINIDVVVDQAALVIILPSKRSRKNFNKLGIFSNGSNTLIQAIARLRGKGEIFVIMPQSDTLICNAYSSEDDNEDFIKEMFFFNKKKKHISVNGQYPLIEQKYNDIRNKITDEIADLDSKKDYRASQKRPEIHFPDLQNYILSDGESLLVNQYEIFGKDLSAYMLWASMNDQFLNCKLKGIYAVRQVVLDEKEKLKGLLKIIIEDSTFLIYDENHHIFEILDPKDFYYQLIEFFSRKKITSNATNSIIKIKDIEKELLTLTHYLYNKLNDIKNDFILNYEPVIYSEEQYLIGNLIHSKHYEHIHPNRVETKKMMESYNAILIFFEKYKSIYVDPNTQIISKDLKMESYEPSEIEHLKESILYIKAKDKLVKNKTYGWFQDIKDDNNYFINRMKKFVEKHLIVIHNKNSKVKRYISDNPVFNEQLLNLLSYPEDFIVEELDLENEKLVSITELWNED